MTKLRKLTISLFAFIMLFCFAVGISGPAKASAEETGSEENQTVFTMLGASVRYSTDTDAETGIRFGVKLDTTTYDKYAAVEGVETGILVIPASKSAGVTELKLDTPNVKKGITLNEEGSKWGLYKENGVTVEGFVQSIVYLWSIPAKNYNDDIKATAYIKNGEDVIYSDTVCICINEVALREKKTETDADRVAQLESYLNANDYTVEFKDGDVVMQTESYKYGETVTAPDTTKEGYVFRGWDKEFSSKVTESVTYNATYIPLVSEKFFANSTLTDEKVDGYEKVYRIKSTAAGDIPAVESVNLEPYTEVRFKMKRNDGTICFDADNRWDYCTNAGNEWYEFVMTKNTDKGGFDVTFKVNKDNTEYEKTMFKSGYYLGNIFNIEFYDDIADVCITELVGTKDENYVASTLVSEKFFTNSTLTDEKVDGYEKVYMIKATAAGEKPAIEAVNLAEYKEIRFKLKRTAGCLRLDDGWDYLVNKGTDYIDFVMTKNAAGDGWSIAYNDTENDMVMSVSGNILSEIFADLSFYEANTELYITELVGTKDENYVASTLVSEKFFTNSTLTEEKVAGYEKVYTIKATAAGEKPAIEEVNLAEYKVIRFKLKRTAGCLRLDDGWTYLINSGTDYIDFVMTKNAAGDGWSIAIR